jgi:hypothetical protein
MRKRLVCLGAVVAMLLVTASATGAGAVLQPFPSPAAILQERFLGWVGGSATDPGLQPPGFCGEIVNHVFYLTPAGVPVVEANCKIPFGTPLLGFPGGVLDWEPSSGATDAALLAQVSTDFQIVSNPSATLDGRPLHLLFAKTGVYTIHVSPGSLIPTVDPTFPPGQTTARVASEGWTVLVPFLFPGHHTLVLADELDGQPFTATFHITVTL